MATYRTLHRWDVTPDEAIAIQHRLRGQVSFRDEGGPFRTLAAMDVSYDKRSPWIYCAVVVVSLPEFAPLETASVRAHARFPYVPGLLSFRESPAGLEAWGRLTVGPDVLICDGHGFAHPRRFGFACHFGLLVDRPTIGLAKSVLVGEYRDPAASRGSVSDLVDHGERVGAALRTREGAEPVFVSVGHRISLERAVETVLACTRGFRLPEPCRKAHEVVNRLRRQGRPEGRRA